MDPYLPPPTHSSHLIVLTVFLIIIYGEEQSCDLLDMYYVHTTRILQGWRGGARREEIYATLYPEYI